jgi:hypothetical protein
LACIFTVILGDAILNVFLDIIIDALWFLCAHVYIHLEITLEGRTIRIEHCSLSVLAALLPLSLVDCPICPIHFSIAVSFVFGIIALVHVSTLPSENSITVLFVHIVLTFVVVAVRLCTLTPLAFSMLQPGLKVSDVETAVLPLVLSEAFWLPMLILTLELISIAEEI